VNNSCEICGKPLSNFNSVKIGIGPICRNKEDKQMDLPFENHAKYIIKKATEQYIYIEDTGGPFKTVTNDVEYVLSQLKDSYQLDQARIFYKDSFGDIDEIVHRGGIFRSFKHGHEGYGAHEFETELKRRTDKRKWSIEEDYGR
jgi:hypothetical protein